jgi:DNA polymerase
MAIRHPGQRFHVYDISYCVVNDVLTCRLPSGRNLNYHRPRLVPTEDKLRRGPAVSITFEGYNSNPMKGPIGWIVMQTYGGRLAENCTQAVAADIQFEALGRLERRGYPVVMHTHDEAICELPIGIGTHEQMASIMSERPSWASWWPIRADGWNHKRYQKD